MHGWRARIGLIIAHSNTTMEPEFNRVAPDGVSIHAARVPVGERSREGYSNKDQELEDAVRLLSDINAKAFAYACTGVNIVSGDEGDIAQAKKIIALTGRPAIPTSIALVEALAALEAHRIVVATVLPPDLNETVAAYWRTCGFDVLGIGGINLGGPRKPAEPLSSIPISSVGLQTPAVVYNMARSVYDAKADAVVVINANLRSIEIAAQFECDYGIPFISSGIATMWASLQAAGVRESVAGYGRLLEEQPRLRWVRMPQP
jgi:maleate cis-trans isomerase